MSPRPQIVIHGIRPLALTKRQTILVLGSPKLVQRMLHSVRHNMEARPWLTVVREGSPGVEALIKTTSVEEAFERLKAGETPPLMPSEVKRPTPATSGGSARRAADRPAVQEGEV